MVKGGINIAWKYSILNLNLGDRVTYADLPDSTTETLTVITVAAQQDGSSGCPAALSASSVIYNNEESLTIYFSCYHQTKGDFSTLNNNPVWNTCSVTRIG